MERIIYINGYFDMDMLAKFHVKLRTLENDPEHGTEDIILLINSPGGRVAVLDAMLTLIQNSPCNFNTFSAGIAGSCGFMLFILGAKNGQRLVFPHAQLMCHSASGYVAEVDEDGDDMVDIINSRFIQQIADTTGRSISEIEEYFTRDYYFMGDDCVSQGFATSVATNS